MKRKKIILITAVTAILTLCSCGEETISETETPKITVTSTTESIKQANTESTPQTETTVTVTTSDIIENSGTALLSAETAKQTETNINTETKAVTENQNTNADTSIITNTTQIMETFTETSQQFETDEHGAVILPVEEDTQETELISAAQQLYENACEVSFRYHVGCPYNLDYGDSVENRYGWKYYLVTDEGYTSLADVEEDYYKIFAEEYGNDLSELYIEQDGKLYAFDGARDKNVFYKDSQVTGIIEKTDEKIVFSVDNNYTGNDMEPDTPITETEQFSVIIKNGEWRIGDFYLPY